MNLMHFKKSIFPFPHYISTEALDIDYAKQLQEEILNMDIQLFDQMNNWFEQKYLLHDKTKIPTKCMEFFHYLQSDIFIKELSTLIDIPLLPDTDRHFWGIHKFKNGDRLDVHLDAGIYHKNKKKKVVTLGFYLSYNWDASKNKGYLELWEGDPCTEENYKLHNCAIKIPPNFNTMIIFINNDKAWHGSSDAVICSDNSERIFLTCSYLTELEHVKNIPFMKNTLEKALFIQRPNDPFSLEKQKAIQLRVNPKICHLIYHTSKYHLFIINDIKYVNEIKQTAKNPYIVLLTNTVDQKYLNYVDYIHSETSNYLESEHYKKHEVIFFIKTFIV